jgi:hypothetical protein
LATNLSAAGSFPTVSSSLTSVDSNGTVYALYGLSDSGELIEMRQGRSGWTVTNVTAQSRSTPLAPGIVAYTTASKKKVAVSVYGVTADGDVIQYSFNGKKWTQLNLSNFPNTPSIVPESLSLLRSVTAGISIFGLDASGTLWRYRGNVRFGWESVTALSGGPALAGDLAVQFDQRTANILVYGTDRSGSVVQFAGTSGSWSWSLVGSPDPLAAGDLSASGDNRLYSKLVDGALAEFWFDGTWNMRQITTA